MFERLLTRLDDPEHKDRKYWLCVASHSREQQLPDAVLHLSPPDDRMEGKVVLTQLLGKDGTLARS
ncbi:MAG TPA: hypothetical protein VFE61_30545 [Candidatus Sulfotelmatobacter sp.]|nr:hypothetical protein [Candidatus Sulfotelmatobacter sp.]